MCMRWRGPASVVGVVHALCCVSAALVAAALFSGCGSCESTVAQTKLPVLAAGSFDGVALDPTARRLYLADRTNQGIDVVDVTSASPRFVATVPVKAYPNGLAIASDRHRLYAGLEGGVVAVIDTDPSSKTSMTVVDRIDVKQAAVDLVDYSASARRVFAATAPDGAIVAIDPATDKVVNRYPLQEALEQPRYDTADRMLYVSTPSTDTLLQVDPNYGDVVKRYPIPKCHASGLAISPAHQLALVACSGSIAAVDLTTGNYSVSRDVQGGDIITYDSSADRFVVASPHTAKDSSVGVFSGDGTFLGSVAADPKAHAAVFDAASGRVLAPGAVGLMSFLPSACAPPPYWADTLLHISFFAVPLALVGLVLLLYARSRDRAAEHKPRVPRWRQRVEDLAEERARMRALESSILDPPERPNPAG